MPEAGLVRSVSLFALLAALAALSVSCGGAESGSLSIDSARWLAGPEPGAVVRGEWSVGISTPPSCSLLEGRKGAPSHWYDPEGRIELDGDRFRQEFVRDPQSPAVLDPEKDYYVRCRVSVATGKVLEARAPVRGKVPVS